MPLPNRVELGGTDYKAEAYTGTLIARSGLEDRLKNTQLLRGGEEGCRTSLAKDNYTSQ